MKLYKGLFWLSYYCIAQYLPGNYTPFGLISKKIRYFILKNLFRHCGLNVDIGNNVVFFNLNEVEIGDNSGMGAWSNIGSVKIGKNVMMGTHCLIISQNHKFDKVDIPMRLQGFQKDNKIIIEDDVWIGSRVIILPGVKIHYGAIVGAGSVVTKNVLSRSIVAGNPAKFIRSRLDDE